ncbi:conserved exported hypothetical protein [Candidatus Propionivibrio aalborgensis]|uniref:Metal-binding protein n=1 Tax=Candidatus Propionivibrio aalborgensis TaxID=1860101 RepID=A0A1A8XH71_9RHOO|nr:DUF411 domain-containing protein [Candidatus Propionivibrio aalborgensis]SBT04041.1 conserved exported hypothetical protein [Candidatus Propionivibrio aalborgensis]
MKPQLRMTVFLSLFASSVWAAPTLPAVQVYKSPQCGCCEKWVDHMKSAGFKVIAHDTNTVAEHKTRLGVPLAMGSCHTAEVGGYFVEGHVPAGDVKKLLAEKPQAKGLGVPGMPASSPGMDDGSKTPYEVLLVGKDGSTTTFARH